MKTKFHRKTSSIVQEINFPLIEPQKRSISIKKSQVKQNEKPINIINQINVINNINFIKQDNQETNNYIQKVIKNNVFNQYNSKPFNPKNSKNLILEMDSFRSNIVLKKSQRNLQEPELMHQDNTFQKKDVKLNFIKIQDKQKIKLPEYFKKPQEISQSQLQQPRTQVFSQHRTMVPEPSQSQLIPKESPKKVKVVLRTIKINDSRASLSQSFVQPKVDLDIFEFITVIGKGGFGKVWKIKSKANGMFFALKEISKMKIINKNSIKSVMNERNILSTLNSQYIVNIICSFQNPHFLYMIMDIMPGGDLRYHIGIQRKFSQKTTKFFVACILLALGYLSENKILHRDIKPENLVIDDKGYLRLTDFGIARNLRPDNAKDTSGTPGYMAPEVLSHQNHTFTVDYFALGVLTYELMMGKRPFYGKDREEIRSCIFDQDNTLKLEHLPIGWSPLVLDFINSMLEINQENRLGSQGIDQIKEHPWFQNFDWKGIENGTYKSPFTIDLSRDNFRQDFFQKDQINEEHTKKDSQYLTNPQIVNQFKGYDFQNKNPNLNPIFLQE